MTFNEVRWKNINVLCRRELVHKFRGRTLLLLKTLMLQKRVNNLLSIYGINSDQGLDNVLWSPCGTTLHVSIFPYFFNTRFVTIRRILGFAQFVCLGLLQNLDDCGSPPLNSRATALSRATSLRTSDRKSLLSYLGLPLNIFGKVRIHIGHDLKRHWVDSSIGRFLPAIPSSAASWPTEGYWELCLRMHELDRYATKGNRSINQCGHDIYMQTPVITQWLYVTDWDKHIRVPRSKTRTISRVNCCGSEVDGRDCQRRERWLGWCRPWTIKSYAVSLGRNMVMNALT